MKAKTKIISIVLPWILAYHSVLAKPFVGPLVQCGTGKNSECTSADLLNLVFIVINFLVGSAAILAMAYIVYGGIQMVISSGNEDGVKKAKSTMVNAIIGLVMVILSYLIITSITSYFTGQSFDTLQKSLSL
ncbi:MAG TPA: hypothetical protein VFX17_02940 [Patescibacteria group bacterium]|nr:hypothetical protein [Patescibacteria group bacterium]